MSSGKWRPSCLGLNVLNSNWAMVCYDKSISRVLYQVDIYTNADLLSIWSHKKREKIRRQSRYYILSIYRGQM